MGSSVDGKVLTIDDQEQLFNQTEVIDIADSLLDLVEKEKLRFPVSRGQSSKRIFIGGFSLGSMTAVSTFLRQTGPEPLGGVIGIAGYIPLEETYFKKSKAAIKAQQETPLLLINGDADETVDIIQAAYTYFYFERAVFKTNKENYTFLRELGKDHVNIKNKQTFFYLAHWLKDKTRDLSKDINSGGNDPIEPNDNPEDDSGKIDAGGSSNIKPENDG